MPWDGSGNFSPSPAPNFPAVTGDVIDATYYNAVINDLATGIGACLTKDNQAKPSADQNWNGKDLTNVDAISAVSATFSTALGVASGGTGVSSTPTNGQILIGNGTNFTLAAITAGSNVTVTNGAGTITIAAPNLMPLGGGTMTGKLITAATALANAGIGLPHGTAPSAPANGDLWSTTAGFFGQVNGTTVQFFPYAGGTLTGKVTTVASASGGAGLNLPHGSAPSSPVNGDVWTTTSGLLARINGSTQTLLSSPMTGGFVLAAGTTSLTPLTFTAGTDNTTPVDGGKEYDGTCFYASNSTTMRQVDVASAVNLTTGVNTVTTGYSTSLSTGTITLPIGLYLVEVMLSYNGLDGSPGTFSVRFDGTATASVTGAWILGKGSLAHSYVWGSSFPNSDSTSSSDATTTGFAMFKGVVVVTGAGTMKPQTKVSTGVADVSGYSYMTVTPVSGGTSSIAVGAWS